jgi:hypothetical protein
MMMMMMMMNRMDPTNHLKCFYLKKARRFCIKLLCKDGGDSILRKKAQKCQRPTDFTHKSSSLLGFKAATGASDE